MCHFLTHDSGRNSVPGLRLAAGDGECHLAVRQADLVTSLWSPCRCLTRALHPEPAWGPQLTLPTNFNSKHKPPDLT